MSIRNTNQYWWNLFFSLVFLAAVIAGMGILATETYRSPFTLRLTDFVLITLASWRLVRLFVYDAITKFVREQFMDGKDGEELHKPERGMRRTLADLFGCPWCMGVWVTAVVVFFYLLTPYAIIPVIILALSAVATFLQLLANLVGHKAEQLKNQNIKH